MKCQFGNCQHEATTAIIICIHNNDDKCITQSPPGIYCDEHVEIAQRLTPLSDINPETVFQEYGQYPNLELSHHTKVPVEEIAGTLDEVIVKLEEIVQDPKKVEGLINTLRNVHFAAQHIN